MQEGKTVPISAEEGPVADPSQRPVSLPLVLSAIVLFLISVWASIHFLGPVWKALHWEHRFVFRVVMCTALWLMVAKVGGWLPFWIGWIVPVPKGSRARANMSWEKALVAEVPMFSTATGYWIVLAGGWDSTWGQMALSVVLFPMAIVALLVEGFKGRKEPISAFILRLSGGVLRVLERFEEPFKTFLFLSLVPLAWWNVAHGFDRAILKGHEEMRTALKEERQAQLQKTAEALRPKEKARKARVSSEWLSDMEERYQLLTQLGRNENRWSISKWDKDAAQCRRLIQHAIRDAVKRDPPDAMKLKAVTEYLETKGRPGQAAQCRVKFLLAQEPRDEEGIRVAIQDFQRQGYDGLAKRLGRELEAQPLE